MCTAGTNLCRCCSRISVGVAFSVCADGAGRAAACTSAAASVLEVEEGHEYGSAGLRVVDASLSGNRVEDLGTFPSRGCCNPLELTRAQNGHVVPWTTH